MMDHRARMDDGREVFVVETGRGPGTRSQFALHDGEVLVRHPDDIDNTLFLTALTRRTVRLISGRHNTGAVTVTRR